MRRLVVLFLSLILLTNAQKASSQNQSESVSVNSAATFNYLGLSADAFQLAEQLGIADELRNFLEARTKDPNWRQSTIVQSNRQDLLEELITAELQVRTAQSALDKEIALADDLRAKLEERRDKAVTLTAAANLLTSAFNGIAGNSLDFSEKLKLPSDILDVTEGGVAAGLAALALYQQSGEKKLSGSVRGILSRIFDTSSQNLDYPDPVWTFLNTVPASSTTGLTRRVALVNQWTKEGIIRRGQNKWEHRLSHITSGTVDRHRITISVLEDRDAMLHDLRAAISPMEALLLEIMYVLRKQR